MAQVYPRWVYPLPPMTQEQAAVTFAMCSRNPKGFEDIARTVTEAKAADFNEKWVVGYGHSSVAEHAIIQLAVENFSRIAIDALEDCRLGSFTEKSSRYQTIFKDSYHVPEELHVTPALRELFEVTCDNLMEAYGVCMSRATKHLKATLLKEVEESDTAFESRVRRTALDSCRFLLPAAVLTNVGVTMNARSMERTISKMLSSRVIEVQRLGELLKEESLKLAPTLVKYATPNPFIVSKELVQHHAARHLNVPEDNSYEWRGYARLVDADAMADSKALAALLYRHSPHEFERVLDAVNRMTSDEICSMLSKIMADMGPHDAAPREFETVTFTFEVQMDYGAYREFKRHRMLTILPKPLTAHEGYDVPELIQKAQCERIYRDAMNGCVKAYSQIQKAEEHAGQYVVAHGFLRSMLVTVNLRELYHLFKLRTSPQAHFSIRGPMKDMLALAEQAYPLLFQFLKLR